MVPDAWWKSWLVWLAIGLAMFLWAGLAMGRSLAEQQAEQQRRDAHWQEVNAAAARKNPRVLPGEEKPAPAPLRGRGWIALLAIAATVAVGRAGWLWLDRLRSLWSPGGTAAADSELAQTVREPTLERPRHAAPVPPSRDTTASNAPLTPSLEPAAFLLRQAVPIGCALLEREIVWEAGSPLPACPGTQSLQPDLDVHSSLPTITRLRLWLQQADVRQRSPTHQPQRSSWSPCGL